MDRFQDRATKYFRSATSKWWWQTPSTAPTTIDVPVTTNSISTGTGNNMSVSTGQHTAGLQLSTSDHEDDDEALDDVVDILSPEDMLENPFTIKENDHDEMHGHQVSVQSNQSQAPSSHHNKLHFHRLSFRRQGSPQLASGNTSCRRQWSRQFSLDQDSTVGHHHSSHSPLYHEDRNWEGAYEYEHEPGTVPSDTHVYSQFDAYQPINDYAYRSRRPLMARSNTEPESQSFDMPQYSETCHYGPVRYSNNCKAQFNQTAQQHPAHSSTHVHHSHAHQWQRFPTHHYRPPNPQYQNSSSASSLLLMMMPPNGSGAASNSNSSADASPIRGTLSRTASRSSAGSYTPGVPHHQKRLLGNRASRLPMLFTSQSVDETCTNLTVNNSSHFDESGENLDSLMKRSAASANQRSNNSRRVNRRWHQPLACSFSVDLPETRPSLLVSSPGSPSPPHSSMNALRSGSESVSNSVSPSESNCRISPNFSRRGLHRQPNTLQLTRQFDVLSLSPVENGVDIQNRAWQNSAGRLLPGTNRQLPTIQSLPVIANNSISPVDVFDASRSASPQDYVQMATHQPQQQQQQQQKQPQQQQLFVPTQGVPHAGSYGSLSNESLNVGPNYHSAAQSPSHNYSANSPNFTKMRKQFSLDNSDLFEEPGDFYKNQFHLHSKRVLGGPHEQWRKSLMVDKTLDMLSQPMQKSDPESIYTKEEVEQKLFSCEESIDSKLLHFAREGDDPDAEQERREDYARFGYFPGSIFDLVNERYSLICKIGWGQFSTVWLARDIQEQVFVAIKIVRAQSNYYQSAVEEIINLKKIAVKFEEAEGESGPSHLIQLLDSFIVRSVNGIHKCLVFEIMGNNFWEVLTKTDYEGIPLPNVQIIMKQILEGVDFLHRVCKLIHSDLKPENILLCGGQEEAKVVAFKALYLHYRGILSPSKCANASGQVFVDEFIFRANDKEPGVAVNSVRLSDQNVLALTHPVKLGQFNGKFYPEYACEILEEGLVLINSSKFSETPNVARKVVAPGLLNIKIADLGSSYLLRRYYTMNIQTRQYRAPEVILDAGFDELADIWSVGCIAYELATGDFLFNPKSQNGHHDRDMEHLAAIQEVLGEIPTRLARFASNYRHMLVTKTFPIKLVSTSLKELLIKKNWNDETADRFVEFLSPMLEIDPARRASASVMLKHRFLSQTIS